MFAERAGEDGGDGARSAGTQALARAGETTEGTAPDGLEDALAVYPNPAGASAGAVVALTLTDAADVRVVVYDVLGHHIAELADGRLEAGTHRFNLDGSRLPAGLYFVRVEGQGNARGEDPLRLSQRITLVR